jgi:hypothetical protein
MPPGRVVAPPEHGADPHHHARAGQTGAGIATGGQHGRDRDDGDMGGRIDVQVIEVEHMRHGGPAGRVRQRRGDGAQRMVAGRHGHGHGVGQRQTGELQIVGLGLEPGSPSRQGSGCRHALSLRGSVAVRALATGPHGVAYPTRARTPQHPTSAQALRPRPVNLGGPFTAGRGRHFQGHDE